ncbi:MAG: hypothetical protein ACPHM2_10350, partial [Alcanivorax sp.]
MLDKVKLSQYEWDDTKSGCQTFWQFMMDFSMLVRMLLHGDIIEDFLDVKCKRERARERQPQWVSGDPDLQYFERAHRRRDQPKRSPSKKSTASAAESQDSQRTVSETQDGETQLPKPRGSPSVRGQAHSPFRDNISGTSIETGVKIEAIRNRIGVVGPEHPWVIPLDDWPDEV